MIEAHEAGVITPADTQTVASKGIGARIRAALGQLEKPVSEAYRRAFVDLDAFVDRIAAWVPRPCNVLEVGCGEGSLAERLTRRFPQASYLGIDVSPAAGRLYGGSGKAQFQVVTAQALEREARGTFDLIIIADVLHHVPDAERDAVLAAVRGLCSEDGTVIFKDWAWEGGLIDAACWGSDRYLTGDQNVRYMTQTELRERVGSAFGKDATVAEATIAPWRQNHAFAIKPIRAPSA
jgi:2-polyprenyl-6-hydroxyphenyl methylase/3-demethylubiquinone-9 3-methyltransferase